MFRMCSDQLRDIIAAKKLIKEYPEMIMIIKYENLVTKTQQVVNSLLKVSKYFLSNFYNRRIRYNKILSHFQQCVECIGLKKIYLNQRKVLHMLKTKYILIGIRKKIES